MKIVSAAVVLCMAIFSARGATAASANWGYMANSGFDGQPMKGIYFFAGEAKSSSGNPNCQGTSTPMGLGVSVTANPCSYTDSYGEPAYSGFNSTAYTFVPIDQSNLQWHSGGVGAQWPVVHAMYSAHANTIVMSYWGEDWMTDNEYSWVDWAPMQTAPGAIDELFAAVDTEALLGSAPMTIMPAIEIAEGCISGSTFNCCTGTSCGFSHYFDANPWSSSNPIVQKIETLIHHYINAPTNSRYPSYWTRLYDQLGNPVYAVNLVNAASDTITDPAIFVEHLDLLADKILFDTGVSVGFTIDPSSGAGLSPGSNHSVPFGSATSFLAIQGLATYRFSSSDQSAAPEYDNNDGACGKSYYGTSNLPAITAWKRTELQTWESSGIPVFLDISPGYDGRYVWGAKGSGVLGDNSDYYDDRWRNDESQLSGSGVRGIVFDTWNGYTEGWIAVPSYPVMSNSDSLTCSSSSDASQQSVVHEGASNSVQLNWLTDLFSADPRTCTVPYYASLGVGKYWVYGYICQRWQALGGSGGFGPPNTSEQDTPGHAASGGRYNQFNSNASAIVWGSAGAFELYGAIYQKYYALNMDASALGLPTTTEMNSPGHAWTGGRYVQFSGNAGAIFWGAPGAWEIYGLIYQTYKNMGSDASWLGLPTTGEINSTYWCPDGRANIFQHGFIDYCPHGSSWAGKCPFGSVCAHT